MKRKKKEDIQKISNEIFGNYYFNGLVETKPRKKGSFTCSIHNTESSQSLSKHFLGRHCCSICLSIRRSQAKLTGEKEILKILKEKKYPFKYKGRTKNKKLSFYCKKHHEIFSQGISSFKKGSNPCKKCYRENKKSPSNKLTDIIIKERTHLKHQQIHFLKRDVLDYRKGIFKCNEHGSIEGSKLIHSIISRGTNPCIKCVEINKKNPIKFTDKYIQDKLDKNNHGIIYLKKRDPLNSRKGYFLCEIHGVIDNSKHLNYQMRAKNPMSCCEKCKSESISQSHGTKLSKDDIQRLSDESFGFFRFLRRDKYDKSMAYFLCNKHPHKGEQKQNIQNHLKGHNPCCNFQSKQEEKINAFLKSLNLKFETQKMYNNCKNIHCLPFDFYIHKYNLLIEYDGRQHYKAIKYFGGKNSLNEIRIRDNIKNEFAKNNKFNFIRIPFTRKKEISKIILEAIKKIELNKIVYKIYLI